MGVRRIIFVSERKQKILCERIEKAINEWIVNWSFNRDQKVNVESIENIDVFRSFPCYKVKHKDGILFWVGAEFLSWTEMLWKDDLPEFPADTVGEKLVQDGIKAFHLGMLKSLVADDINEYSIHEEDQFDKLLNMPREQILGFNIKVNSQEIKFAMEISSWLDKYKEKNTQENKVCQLHDVLGRQEANLTIDIDFGEIDLDTLSRLAAGDVLTSRISLESLFNVSINEKKIAESYLGRKGNKKAVQLQLN